MKKLFQSCFLLIVLWGILTQTTQIAMADTHISGLDTVKKEIFLDGSPTEYSYVTSVYSEVPRGQTLGRAKRSRYFICDVEAYVVEKTDGWEIWGEYWSEQHYKDNQHDYANTTGFEMNLPNREYEVEVTFSNPYEEDYSVEVWDEYGKQTKKKRIEAGKTESIRCTISVIGNNLKLFFRVKSDAVTPENGFKKLYVNAIHIKTLPRNVAANKPTIHIVGDSISHSYSSNVYPRTGWGQTIIKYMENGTILYEKVEKAEHDLCDYTEYGMPSFTVKNWAHSGDSSESFWRLGKFDSILNYVCPGDYLLIQLGSNDSRNVPGYYSTPEEYSANMERFLVGCKERGAQCILLSPTPRCEYTKGVINTMVPDYKAKLKPLASKTGAIFIDTGGAVEEYMTTVGETKARTYYMIFGAGIYPHYPNGENDTHHYNVTGAMKLGHILAAIIKENSKTPEFLSSIITVNPDYYEGETVTIQNKTIKKQVTKKKVKVKDKKTKKKVTKIQKTTRYKLSWKKQKHAKKYIIYSYDKTKKTYKKLKTTKKTSYLLGKKWKKAQVSKMKVVAVLGR